MGGVVCGLLDISDVDNEEMIAISGVGAWIGCDVDEKIYEIQNSPYAYAVIKFSNPCWASNCPEDTSSLVAQSFLMIGNCLTSDILKSGVQNPNVSGEQDLPGSGLPASNVCGVDLSLLAIAQEKVDALQTNEKGFQPAAVKPNACVIPMRSNVFSYGPWASSNFATTYGGADMQVNNDLAPWLFGSSTAMNIAGQELANTSLVGLSRSEKGSATIPGLPTYTIGAALSNGPVLTNISVSFGSNGVTTTYDYATYTPKFGQLSRAIIEKYKTMASVRNEQLRFLRQNAILNNRIARKGSSTKNKGELSKSLSDKNSLVRVFVGEIFDFQTTANSGVGQRTVVGLSTLSKSVLEMRGSGYSTKGFMSLDGLYGPVSINGDGNLPRMISIPTGNNTPSGLAWSVSPNPPVIKDPIDIEEESVDASFINTNAEIISLYSKHMNPLANPGDIEYIEDTDDPVGHCIDIVGRNKEIKKSGLITNFYAPDKTDKYSEDYRFLAMRGPIILHSWGYDTDGKPVPNASDLEDYAKSGVFTTGNLKSTFMSDWLQKPNTWPVAPVDLRLDRERGVWVSPREHNIVTAKLTSDLLPYSRASGVIVLENGSGIYGKSITDSNGNILGESSRNIVIEDRIGSQISANNNTYVYFDTFNSVYIPLGVGGGGTVRVAETEGLWPIYTTKAINILDIKNIDVMAPSVDLDSVTTIVESGVMAINLTRNIAKTDKYTILVTKIDGHYVYLNSNECN